MLKRLFPVFASAAIGAILVWSACTKSSSFGANLLDDQVADFDFVDTFTLNVSLEREDSLITSDLSSTAEYLLCGSLNDPKFGNTTADVYTQFQLSIANPEFDGAELDSVVMYLDYSVFGFYGDTTQTQTLHVHQLADTLRWDEAYYSNSTLNVGDEIGVKSDFLPRPTSFFNFFDTSANVGQSAYIRVPLDNGFGQQLLDVDSLTMTNDTSFWETVRGLRITSSSSMDPGSMMAFDLNDEGFSFIRLYYRIGEDTLRYDYIFLGCNKFVGISHDYAGSEVEPLINNPLDERLYLQSVGGLRLKVEIPYIDQLDDIVVNKAQLELTVEELMDDNPLLTPADQLLLTRLQGDTLFTFTPDVFFSLGSTLTGGFGQFGGFPEDELEETGETVMRYRMNLTQHLQDLVDDTSGEIENKTIYVNVYPQRTNPGRAILYGPTSPKFPAKLSLKYTRY